MRSKLTARLARLGPIRVASRKRFGSSVSVVLRPKGAAAAVKSVDAIRALVGQGTGMLEAKRAIEAMLVAGEVTFGVREGPRFAALVETLAGAGVVVSRIAKSDVDVRALREKLGLSREQFALRYNLSLNSVTKWEQGLRKPNQAANNYLRVISSEPRIAARAQEDVA
jgi:putative transcriptional regulator